MTDVIQILILGLALGGVYAIFATGLTLVFGVMRIVNIAHPVFIIAAAYVSYVLFTQFQIDPLISLAVNVPAFFLLGIGIYKLLLARDVTNPRYIEITVLITFALALLVEGILGWIFTGTFRSTNPPYTAQAILLGDFIIPKAQLYAGLLSLGIIGAVWAFLQFTRLGYAIRATMQNRAAAQIMGVDVLRVSTISFGIGIALAGASGSLMSFLFGFFPAKHWEWVATLLALIVLGGMGKILGAIVGSLLLAVAAAFVSDQFGPTWSPVTFYLTLFLILLLRPQGLFGEKLEAA